MQTIIYSLLIIRHSSVDIKFSVYFLSERSHCLDDGPTVDGPSLPPQFRNKLPGQIVDGDGQCEAHYGKGWKRFETVLNYD